MRKEHPWLSLLVWLTISFATLFPIYWLFVISAKAPSELFSTPDVILKSVYWHNYVEVFNNSTLRRYMTNSLIISTSNAFLCTSLGFLAVYALSRFELGAKESVFFWTITNRMAPPASFLLPLFLLLTQVYRIGDFRSTTVGSVLFWSTAPSTYPLRFGP